MAAISFGTIKSLLIFFGPILLQKGLTWYRGAKAQTGTQQKPIAPLRPRALLAVALLVATATVFALATTSLLAPENIFTRTHSTIMTSTALLFRRLAEARGPAHYDDRLRAKFENKASRLLYIKYGGAALAACPFCNSQDPTTYLVYAAPALALPHLLNALVVGIATSEPVTGKVGLQWRALATYAAAAILVVDAYMLASWDPAANENARMLDEVFWFHWKVRMGRFLAFAVLDLALAVLIFLGATNRMFVVPPTVSDKIDGATAALALVHFKSRTASVMKNTIARDRELREQNATYWTHEGIIMQEALESEEVMNALREAVENRSIDVEGTDRAADDFTRRMMGGGS